MPIAFISRCVHNILFYYFPQINGTHPTVTLPETENDPQAVQLEKWHFIWKMLTRVEGRNRSLLLLFISFIIFLEFWDKNQYLLLKLYVPMGLSYLSKYLLMSRKIYLASFKKYILFTNFDWIPLIHINHPSLLTKIIYSYHSQGCLVNKKNEQFPKKIVFQREGIALPPIGKDPFGLSYSIFPRNLCALTLSNLDLLEDDVFD